MQAVLQRRSGGLACQRRSSRVRLHVAATSSVELAAATKVELSTTSGCQLAVSIYPMFSYNAAGGGGSGTVHPAGDGKLQLTFDETVLNIPALNYKTGKLLGIPLPPFLQIAIKPQQLQGILDPATGEINLTFDAQFMFSVGSLYKAPPLLVSTNLTTEGTQGRLRSGTGRRLAGGKATLVGVSEVPKTGDLFMDTFLMLPTDALAIMDAQLEFQA